MGSLPNALTLYRWMAETRDGQLRLLGRPSRHASLQLADVCGAIRALLLTCPGHDGLIQSVRFPGFASQKPAIPEREKNLMQC